MSVKSGILVAVGVIAAAIGLTALGHRIADERRQDSLDTFYAAPTGFEQARLGALLRLESLPDVDVAGATAYRVLYRTERSAGSPAVSGAVVYVPTAPAPAQGRPVLAYAHGTIGLGRGCAPSRRQDPVGPGRQWIPQAVSAGFTVVATDYAGLGTPGPAQFLIGRSEANDLVNSVRALDDVPGADPGREWAVMGHSQGGHSALWAGLLADELMPERPLVGVGAIAPAADLVRIIGAQWDTGIGWGVGAEVYASWPYVYPAIDFDRVVTATGRRWAGPVADACLGEGVPVPAIIGFGAAWLGQPFFDGNPVRAQDMYDAAAEQTPAPLPATLPLMIAQGTADAVIPPEANAILQESWCAAGSNLTMLWLGGIGHIQSLQVAAPTVVPWLRARFADPPPRPSCDWVPPIGVPQAVLRDVGAALD